MNNPQSLSPWQMAMDFAQFRARIWDDLTGSKSRIEERGKIRMSDGTEYPNLVQVTEQDPYAIPVCNDNGGRRVLHQLDLIMNPHTSFANLSRDEIAEIAENSCRQAFGPMFANLAEYGITNMNKLEAEGLSMFDTLYIFLTTLKDGGAKNVALGLYQIKVESRQEGEREKQGLI